MARELCRIAPSSNQSNHLFSCHPNFCRKGSLIDIKINTYFFGDGKFVPFDEFGGPLEDLAYVEGCIDLDIEGVSLINSRYSDWVDQLWSYLIDGLSSVKQGKNFECYFPESPIKISMKCIGKDWIEFSVAETAVKVQLKPLTDAMTREAYHFFQKMKELDTQESEFWQSRCEFIQSYF